MLSSILASSKIPSSLAPLAARAYHKLNFDEDQALTMTAGSAYLKSCFKTFDWKVSQDATCAELMARMVSHKVGALAVVDGEGEVTGIVSERDVVYKVAFLNKLATDVKVSEIAVMGRNNIVNVSAANPIDACMEKLLARDVRHLMLRESSTNQNSRLIGIISIKDVVKCALEKHKAQSNKLEDIITYQTIVNSAN